MAMNAGWVMEILHAEKLVSTRELLESSARWLDRSKLLVREHPVSPYIDRAISSLRGEVQAVDANRQWKESWRSSSFPSVEVMAFVCHALAAAAASERCPDDPEKYTMTSLGACVSCFLAAVDHDHRVVLLLDSELASIVGPEA
jgi:hypothetical protein